MGKPVLVPGWLLLSIGVVVGANLLAGLATNTTIALMQGVSDFARAARAHDVAVIHWWEAVTYPVLVTAALVYIWPLVAWFRCGTVGSPGPVVQRRAISAPLVVAMLGFSGWLSGVVLFPLLTIVHFGRWSTELMSQQVLSPLVNGFLAATVAYLSVDWVFRTRVVPHVFPDGRLADVEGALALGVRGRLIVFLVAVAFLPLFTMLGLVRAAAVRLAAGMPFDTVLPALVRASEGTFALYVALGVVLTLLLARTLTRPLGDVAQALRRVQRGEPPVPVRVTAGDEVGVVEDGVNAMIETLREKERILQTFGRVVEPEVRDRLLAGDLQVGGELRSASILFCDLRGFTALAQHTPPQELVATLNDFFTAMTGWARTCGGFVDKFVGDGILVVFGLFQERDGSADGAAAAVRCALGMRERLAQLNVERAARGGVPLGIKVGVNTGPVLAGRLGAADRHEYTVIGDTVNVAARLEELCREHGCDVMVAASTWDLARAAGVALPECVAGPVTPRGRDEPVQVYRIT